MVASLTLVAAATLADVALPASLWHGEPALFPVAAADVIAGEPSLHWNSNGVDYSTQHAHHRPAERLLHPSTLALSEYPTVGGGTAELVFTVTYAGDMRQGGGDGALGPPEPPVVRLDVTGSDYRNLYRVTNITSNIGAASPSIFEAYDHEAETVRADLGVTYTVKATVEFVAEDFIPVYAVGFDGDVVTVNVAASELVSMPYSEYMATRQSYLDRDPVAPSIDPAHIDASAPEKRRAGDHLASGKSLPPMSPASRLGESSMRQTFNATGTVMGENATGELAPVHGIGVCVYDRSSPLNYTLLSTAADEPACGYTDADGKYEIVGVGGGDPDGDMTAVDVFVSVESYGYGDAIELFWYDPSYEVYGVDYDYDVCDEYAVCYVYYADSDTETDYGGALLVKNFSFIDADPDDEGMAGAARIINALSDGMSFFEDHGQDPASLRVMWNYMNGSRVISGAMEDGAFYRTTEATIFLNGDSGKTSDDSRSRYTVLHEFGHHVHYIHDPNFDYSCVPHYIDKKYDERCAWGEGWGGLVPHLVDDNVELLDGVDGFRVNIEAGLDIRPDGFFAFDTFGASGRPIGEKVEGSVAAAMWDMADTGVDPDYDMSGPGKPVGGDNTSAGVDGLLDVFFDGTYDTFADFYDRWEIDMRHDSAESIAVLHGMSFAIPANMSYYGFAGELDGVFKYGMTGLFLPNYVDVSDDGSIIAITSLYGRGLQMVDTRSGEHKGLYATRGYDHACTLEEYPFTCMFDTAARATADLGPAEFSSMDGIAFGLDSSVILVSDQHQNRVQVFGSDGGHAGEFGTTGADTGEFRMPHGVTFLANDTTAAVADAGNARIQTFEIAGNGNAQHSEEFQSYKTDDALNLPRQQLATGPDGTLYAAAYETSSIPPRMWLYPPPHDSSTATRIDDTSLCNLGGIAVDSNGLVYVTDPDKGRVRVYDPDMLRGSVNDTASQLGGRPLIEREVLGSTSLACDVDSAEAFIDEFGSRGPHAWQLGEPLGIALGPPDVGTGDVRVYVADTIGIKMYEKDREAPRVKAVWAHTPDGTVVQGDTVEIAVNFTERVTVTGTPVLVLDTGVVGSNASYVSGSGSHTLTFNYTVGTGAVPSYIDYAGAGSLQLSGGNSDLPTSIVDGSGNAADLALPARGTAATLASNAALWIGTTVTGVAPFGIAPPPMIEAVEHQQVRFDVAVVDNSASAASGSYLMTGAPSGAVITPDGTFTWIPDETQDGMHAFAVQATSQDDPSRSHARTFWIQVDEDNAPPEVDPVPNRRAIVLSELRFDFAATDDDLPAQSLEYCLASDRLNYATVLPNGTFVWTPSEYDMGVTEFSVRIADVLDSGRYCNVERDSAVYAGFNVTVIPRPPPSPVSVYAPASGGPSAVQVPVYTGGQIVRIAVEFSEPVVVMAGPGGEVPHLALRIGTSNASAPYDSGNGTRTLVFAYVVRGGDATDRLSYAGTGALSLNASTITARDSEERVLNALPEPGSSGSLADSSRIRIDAVLPVVESVYALAGDGSYGVSEQVDIGVRLSENVTVLGLPAIALDTGATNRDAVYQSGNSTDTLVFRYTVRVGDSTARLGYAGVDALKAVTGTSIRDAAGNDAVLTLPAPGDPGSLAHSASISIGNVGQVWTGEDSVTLNIGTGGIAGSGNVAVGGDGLRVTLNVGSIVGAGSDGIAIFPQGGAAVNTTFALVTFPPGVMATSVPADNLLVLYVADGVPDNSSMQRVLGYDGSNPVVLQRVVEIGDEDGRVEFDLPVRISLEGLAGGRAFYVGGPGGTIAPIDRACAADDLQRVHRQLGGAGECQLDSGTGDKVIYTYHLTRFGTVLSESGAPAAPDHTCSMRLALSSLGVENARPGVDSPDASQTVVNSGSLPFDRIELDATPWYVDLGGAEPGPDTRSLNASITEVREEEGGAYRTVYSSGTAVAEGLGGGLEAPLWFRLNLAAHGDVHGVDLTQYITYVAECGGPAGQR